MGRKINRLPLMLRRYALPFSLLLLLIGCDGISDEYGRRHQNIDQAVAQSKQDEERALASVEPLAHPIAGQTLIALPTRAQIYEVIKEGRPAYSLEYLEANTEIMETNAEYLPKLLLKRNLFESVRSVRADLATENPPSNGFLIQYSYDLKGTHIFVQADGEIDVVEMERPWVGAPDHLSATKSMLIVIENYLRSRVL